MVTLGKSSRETSVQDKVELNSGLFPTSLPLFVPLAEECKLRKNYKNQGNILSSYGLPRNAKVNQNEKSQDTRSFLHLSSAKFSKIQLGYTMLVTNDHCFWF